MAHRYRQRKPLGGNFDQNDGVAGVVYILRNEAFKENWLKIGQSRHSGHVRARDMNKTASTGLPAHHICVFECRTLDCGKAEKQVFQQLQSYRKGRQEFFEIDIEFAKTVIVRVCGEIDESVRRTLAERAQVAREAAAQREAAAKRTNDEFLREAAERRKRADYQAEQAESDPSHRAREEQKTSNPPATVDMTCPSCSLVLSIPAGVAGISDQKLRCKNCFAVFLPNGQILSRAFEGQPGRAAETTNYTKADPWRKDASAVSTRKADWLVVLGGLAAVIFVVVGNRKTEQPPPPPPPTKVQIRPSVAPPPPAAIPKTEQQLMDEAAQEMVTKYPYLDTSSGEIALDVIRHRRDELISNGISPPSALRLAVLEIAPLFQPPP